MKKILTIAGLLVLGQSAFAAGQYTYWADPTVTDSWVFGVNSNAQAAADAGHDRALRTIGFKPRTPAVSPVTNTIMGNTDFLKFNDGSLKTNGNTYGWTNNIPRDTTTSGQLYQLNPDQGDNTTGSPQTLQDVFGPYAGPAGPDRTGYSANTAATISEDALVAADGGYKNMGYLIDGENELSLKGNTHMDLLFGNNLTINSDSNQGTVEVAILERGGESNFRVYGITASGLTSTFVDVAAQRQFTQQIWRLNSLEISGGQPVVGYGLSLDTTWDGLLGFRIEAIDNTGPDIIGVGVLSDPIPEPAFYQLSALVLMGGVGLRMRRRSKKA